MKLRNMRNRINFLFFDQSRWRIWKYSSRRGERKVMKASTSSRRFEVFIIRKYKRRFVTVSGFRELNCRRPIHWATEHSAIAKDDRRFFLRSCYFSYRSLINMTSEAQHREGQMSSTEKKALPPHNFWDRPWIAFWKPCRIQGSLFPDKSVTFRSMRAFGIHFRAVFAVTFHFGSKSAVAHFKY